MATVQYVYRPWGSRRVRFRAGKLDCVRNSYVSTSSIVPTGSLCSYAMGVTLLIALGTLDFARIQMGSLYAAATWAIAGLSTMLSGPWLWSLQDAKWHSTKRGWTAAVSFRSPHAAGRRSCSWPGNRYPPSAKPLGQL